MFISICFTLVARLKDKKYLSYYHFQFLRFVTTRFWPSSYSRDSRDITAAMSVSPINETAAVLVSLPNPPAITELFIMQTFSFVFVEKHHALLITSVKTRIQLHRELHALPIGNTL